MTIYSHFDLVYLVVMLSLGDLEAIQDRLSDVDGERPFVYHEVIDHGTEPITMDEYDHLGKVTEFNVGSWISCIKNNGFECYNGYPGVSSLALMP